MVEDEDDEDETGGGGIPAELLKSYLAFGKRAISRRRLLVFCVFVTIAGFTLFVAAVWPRTYHCESRLMAQRNEVFALRGDSGNDPLRGASDLVLRRENLEAIVKQTDLLRRWDARRPWILKLRDSLLDHLRTRPSDKDRESGLVFTLENKLTAVANDETLTFAVDWQDAETSARILQAAEDNFLEVRHVAEISTLSEYISILEGHATTLRAEVDQIADQIRKLRASKVAAAEQKFKAGRAADAHAAAGASAEAPRRVVVSRASHEPDAALPQLKEQLEEKQRAIAGLEDYRNRRLLDLQSKLADLQSKYTAAHPLIVDMQQNIAAVSHEAPQVTALRAEVKDLTDEIKRRSTSTSSSTYTVASAAGGTGNPGIEATSAAAPLPPEIMNLMQENVDELDPAVAAQLRYAVEKYTTLRGQISSSRIDLDTAQAAFKHRYKVVVPPEVPRKAIKPKVALIVIAGFFAAILLALFSAIAAELRSGRIVERWQVQQLALPVLGELRFPPRSGD